MNDDELIKMIASAVIAYIIPKALGSIGKGFRVSQ